MIYSWNAVRKSLYTRRGSNAQEEFMFEILAPFIEFNGVQALREIDAVIRLLPRNAKYYFTYLLGHIEHEATLQARIELLNKYSRDDDEDIRNGSNEALGYLSDS